MMALMPPSIPASVPRSPRVSSRPPAYLSTARGSASRKAAIVLSASVPPSSGRYPRGGPGRGGLPGEFAALAHRLAHPDDPAAAQFQAGGPDQLAGVEPLLPAVRRHHMPEVRAGRLQVVVVAVHPQRGQLSRLGFGEDAERARDVDVHLVPDRGDRGRDLGHQPLVGPAHRGDDAELGRSRRRRLPCRRHELVDVQPDGAHRGLELAGLRAEVAVLRAAAGLHRHDPLDLHLGAAPPHPHLVGQRQQLAEALVRQLKAAQDLLLVQPAARFEDLAARLVQNVVGHTSSGSAQTSSAALTSSAAHTSSSAAHTRSFCHALISRNASGSKQPPNVAARPALAALRNAARSSVPAPSLSTPCTRPRVRTSRSVMLLRSAIPGFSGHDPRISPSSVIPREASASRVSAVWFSVPSPGAATTSTAAPSASARSAMVPPAGSYRTSSPPAPSTSTCCLVAARPRTVSAAAARSR